MNHAVCLTTALGVTICSRRYIWKCVVGVHSCLLQKDRVMLQEVLRSAGRLGDYQGIDVSFLKKFEAELCEECDSEYSTEVSKA